ncbi:MAG: DUF480 domain-containing protein [Planctomycetota bacterium]|nr:DUF480 domain-containing protein [Planctomycetota bacterium]
MIQLNPSECRVLGVLVEKAHTSSAYPLSLNAATDGCNQKSNRDPVVAYDEQAVMQALDGLRDKRLAIFADSLGARVTKFRHNAREALGLAEGELLVLTELLLRGPQTAAELRTHASRMRPLESVEVVQEALRTLMDRPEPLVQRIPGGRAERFAQLLCPALHSLAEPPASANDSPVATPDAADRIARLETEVARLRDSLERLAAALGAADILNPPDPQ